MRRSSPHAGRPPSARETGAPDTRRPGVGLDWAEQPTTDPDRAAAMYRAVIELYQDKPWAADAVRRARGHLDEDESQDKQP